MSLSEISVDPLDLGVQRGYSVFDFFKLKNLDSPYLDDYLSRFMRSVQAINLNISWSKDDIKTIAKDVLSHNQQTDGYIKIIASGGVSSDGFHRIADPSLLVMAMPIKEKKASLYEKGAHLITSEYQRDIPHVKTTNYLHSAMHAEQLANEKAIDLLYHDNGLIREASRCNFFLIKDQELHTPANKILHGITRKRVLKTNIGIPHHEVDIPIVMLSQADEVFITSTTKGVMPITQIDNTNINSGSVGPITMMYMEQINMF